MNATVQALAQGTAFTYHGGLNDNGSPAQGSYDLIFSVFEADIGTNQVGVTITNTALQVSGGLFTATLDFGPGIFTGPDRWLEIGVRTIGGAAFATLTPRQKVTAAPYAITASNLSGTLAETLLPGNVAKLDADQAFAGANRFAGVVQLTNPRTTPLSARSLATAVA